MGNFKKLHVWEDSINLSVNIYHLTRQKPFSSDFGLSNQIQRASVSIASNIAEGEEQGSNKSTIHYFNIAKGSAAEVVTQLYIAYKIGYIEKQILDRLENDLDKIRATLQSLINKKKRL
jgi:four helix bundle protein